MKKLLIGVDLGGTKISTGIADRKGKLLHIITVPTQASSGPRKVIKRIEDSILAACAGAKVGLKDVDRIGIGAPGPVINDHVIDPPNLIGWKKVPLKSLIAKHLKKKVILENDANCAALAELKFGAGRKFSTFIYVTISTGIGGGIIIDKKLYKGSRGSAGEIGHTVIEIDGPICPCGKPGHLEGLAAGPAIAKRSGMSPEKLNEAAKNRDPNAINEIIYTGNLIGIGFSNLVNILNPEAIIVGGGISNFGSLLFDSIRSTVKEMAIADVKIIPAKLHKNVGVMGAVALCL